jgi:hypothetical protein
MSKLAQFLHRQLIGGLQEEAHVREVGRAIFEQWRNGYINALCFSIRLHAQAQRLHVKVPDSSPSPAWCNAAAHILLVGDELLQDYFLRVPPEIRNRLVDAVLADGGLENIDGFFVELPVL